MKNNKKVLTIAAVAVCLLAAGSLSKPGRVFISKAIALVQPGPDVERRARAKHGWNVRPILNSVMRGTISYFDGSGREVRRYRMRLYRKYPERLRLEIEREGRTIVTGFDGRDAWRAGATRIDEVEAREVRGLLRAWPERLFVAREGGARYREVGRRLEDFRPTLPGRGSAAADKRVLVDEVEVEDIIGPREQPPGRVADRRRVYYSINSETSLVEMARWMEPIDVRQEIDNRGAGKVDMRVDFSRWRQVGDLLWPREVVRWRGGRVDYRIEVDDVLLNQQMPDTLFQNPNR